MEGRGNAQFAAKKMSDTEKLVQSLIEQIYSLVRKNKPVYLSKLLPTIETLKRGEEGPVFSLMNYLQKLREMWPHSTTSELEPGGPSEDVADDNETWDSLEGQLWDLVNHYEPQNQHIWQQSIDYIFDEHDEEDHLVEIQNLVTQLRSFHEPPPRRIVKPQSKYVSPPKQVHLDATTAEEEAVTVNAEEAEQDNFSGLVSGGVKADLIDDLLEKITADVSQIPAVNWTQLLQWRAKVEPATNKALQSNNPVQELKKIHLAVTDMHPKVVAAVALKAKEAKEGGLRRSDSLGPALYALPALLAAQPKLLPALSPPPTAPPIPPPPALPPPALPSVPALGPGLDLPDYPRFVESYRLFRAASDALQAAAVPPAPPLDPAADLGAQVAALQEAAARAAAEGEALQDRLYAVAGGQVGQERLLFACFLVWS